MAPSMSKAPVLPRSVFVPVSWRRETNTADHGVAAPSARAATRPGTSTTQPVNARDAATTSSCV